MLSQGSFSSFIAKIRVGDEGAAREMVDQFEQIIRCEVRLRLDDFRLRRIFDSMDISQSVLKSFFMRARSGHFEIESTEQLVGLLTQMTRNKLATEVRTQRAGRRDFRLMAATPVEDIAVVSTSPSPDRQSLDRDLLASVRRRFTEEECRIADLRAEGWEWPEIASQLGGSPGGRRMQLTRAVNRVATDLRLDDDQNARK